VVRHRAERGFNRTHLAELDGLPPVAPTDPDALAAKGAVLLADLAEPARVTALEKLDEGRRR
jgi:hypothetical protein